MIVAILFVVLGTIIIGVGFRMVGKSAYSMGTSRGRLVSGTSGSEKAQRDEDTNERLIGRFLKLLGAVFIACGVYLLAEALLSNI
jgi:hypothetical protein